MITLCGRLTQISMSAHGTSTEEDFEVIKFIEKRPIFYITRKTLDQIGSSQKKRRGSLRAEEARIKRYD
jgi:hypothetical protein